jgi:plasmid stabilization system protein ParE
MARFVLTPAARADLAEISDYISKDNPDAANRVLDELRAAMRKLAEMPEMGHSRRDLASESLRFWPLYSYLIIYRPEARPLQVVRVLHGSRDVHRILEEIS